MDNREENHYTAEIVGHSFCYVEGNTWPSRLCEYLHEIELGIYEIFEIRKLIVSAILGTGRKLIGFIESLHPQNT